MGSSAAGAIRARKYFSQWRRANPCVVCHEPEEACLSAHHVRPNDKRSAVSTMVQRGLSVPAIQSELDKCVSLCHNCHALHHNGLIDIEMFLRINDEETI